MRPITGARKEIRDGTAKLKHCKLLILHRKVNSGAPTAGPRRRHAPLSIALLAPLVLIALTAPLEAKTYRWVDDNGTVVYSQIPPPDDRPTAAVAPPPPPPIPPAEAREQLEERMQKLDDLREDQELAREKRAKGRRERAEKRRACQAARNNLVNLERSMNKQMKMPDGSYQRFDETERQTRIREARASIESNCE